MGRNAVIQIEPNIAFQSVTSKYFRCGNDFWTGFVLKGGTSDIWFNHIEDAAIAINIMSSSANLVLAGNTINRNNKGLYAQNITVNATVAANIFDCSTPLNASTSPLAYAGVHLISCSAVIGRTDNVPGFRNTFKKQSFGMRISNSTATIGLSTFNGNTRGVYATGSNVTIRGADAGLTTNFSFDGEDVYTTQSSMNLFFCHMDSCKRNNITSLLNNNKEQVHIHDNTIHVTNEPMPANEKFGISLDRSRNGSDEEFRNTIDRNHLIIHDFGGNRRRGMHIRGGASIHDFMRIDSNTIEVMTGGSQTIHTKFVDIDISGADNFKITRNTVRSTNGYATGNNRWGFFMVNGATTPAKGNVFLGNNILGIGPDDGMCAVHAEDAGPWGICSNMTDHAYRGFHFIGSCGKSSFGANTIKDHNVDPLNAYVGGTGIFLQGHGADNVFLGDQECQANMWAVTDYALSNAYTAIVVGNETDPPLPSTIQNNQFKVADLSDPTQAPIDRNPMENWFIAGQCLQTPTDCVENQSTPNFDEQDEWIRNNYPLPQISPSVEEWQSTRYVLAKLMRYPELATGNVLVFKNAYNQSSAALFARFDSMMSAISLATAGSQTNMKNLEISIQSKQAQINALDASITDYTNLEPGLLASRAVLLGELAVLSDQYNVLLTQNISTQESLLYACEQYNNTLPANKGYEQNQKLLNALAIQYARGIELTQVDKDALHAIAQQCTQIAGRTKAAAAAMLPPEEGAQYWRENPDEYNCPQRTARDAGPQDLGFSLSPNPCSDFLNVQFELPFVGNLSISDLSGRVLESRLIHDESKGLSIPVGHLSNGVYLLTCTNSSGKLPVSTKFVVLR